MKYTCKTIDFKSIKEMPAEDRPREKVSEKGPFCLSDLELVCCLLGCGNVYRPVQDIAVDILDVVAESEEGENLMKKLLQIDGLGEAKATTVVAALELGRRLAKVKTKKYGSPESIFNYIRHYADRQQEYFLCIQLNGAMEIASCDVITIGLINRTLCHPREIFAPAIKNRATSVVLAHSHPSGNLEPSEDDMSLTDRIVKAGKIVGINVMDHIIFSVDDYRSMMENGDFYFS